MFSFYLVLKYIHILSAITAVGANITYGVWQVRADRDAAHFSFVLKTIKFLDDRVANPAYGVLLVTGLLMVFVGSWGFQLWIILGLILFAALLVIGLTVYASAQRSEIAAVDSGDTAAAERFGRQAQIWGISLGVIALLVLVTMVFKPHL